MTSELFITAFYNSRKKRNKRCAQSRE